MSDKEKTGSNAKRIRMTLRIDRDTYRELHQYCSDRRAPKNQIIQHAVREFLEEETPTKSKSRR